MKKKELTDQEKAQDRFKMKADEVTIIFRPKCLKCGKERFECECDPSKRKFTRYSDEQNDKREK